MRDLHDEELRALLTFRERHGRRWKAALLLRWSAGADLDEPGSPHLRRLRNIGGPRWLLGLSVAALDDAAARLAGGIDWELVATFLENATGFARGAAASLDMAPARAAHSLAIAIELGLKAYLLQAGYADDWNRIHIRHDLEKALAHATDTGLLGVPKELPDLAAILSPAYSRHQIDALFRGGVSPFDLVDACGCVERLLVSVRAQIAQADPDAPSVSSHGNKRGIADP
ncbi:hypothetical protein QN347_06925 [Sphingomonas sp. 10B4]|nr:hypothetical protein [Sphingomonas sp. 10B4]